MRQCEAKGDGWQCERPTRTWGGTYCDAHDSQQRRWVAKYGKRKAFKPKPLGQRKSREGTKQVWCVVPVRVARAVRKVGKAASSTATDGINPGARRVYEMLGTLEVEGLPVVGNVPETEGVRSSVWVPEAIAAKVKALGGGATVLTAFASGALAPKEKA